MSQISVVHYNPSLNKINVLQQNNVGNKPNERQVIVLRKSPHQVRPNGDLSPSAKKKPKIEKEPKTQPIAVRISVARRNARERNRVKQVNNGFANLRQHIPNFIAAAFENNSGRGGSKKLSKVETLRMAVEYIRSLENILSLSGDGEQSSEVSSYPSPISSSSPNDPNQLTYTYQVLSPPTEEDELVPTDPQQFIKLDPTANSYLIPTTVYENGENLDPMDQHLLTDPSILDSNLEFNQDLSYLHAINSTSSLSPGFYSEEASMSPMSDVKGDRHSYVTVYHTPPGEPVSPGVVVKNEEMDMPVISLKTEADLPEEHQEELEDVLEWWERQPQDIGS